MPISLSLSLSILLICVHFLIPVHCLSLYHFIKPITQNGGSGVSSGTMWQTLDHLSGTDTRTFQQRYFYNEKFALSNRTVAYLFISDNTNREGLLADETSPLLKTAQEFGASVFMLEHRYYGASKPFGPFDNTAGKNLGCLNAYQAILDIPIFIEFANKQFNLAPNVRWVLWGSGYGGFLAAQARRMFPQKVEGVVASSAPMTLQYDFWEFNDHVQLAFFDLGGTQCYQKIQLGFQKISAAMLFPTGRDQISTIFHLNPTLNQTNLGYNDIEMFYSAIIAPFQQVAMYNNYFGISIPGMCKVITNQTLTPIESIYAAYEYLSLTVTGEVLPMMTSYQTVVESLGDTNVSSVNVDQRLWLYQLCSQLGWFQTTNSNRNTLFGAALPSSLFVNQCRDIFPDAQFSASAISSSIFFNNNLYNPFGEYTGTNVVFTNGLYDPWIRLGQRTSSDDSVVTQLIANGSHSNDLFPGATDNLGVRKALGVIRENVRLWVQGPKNPNMRINDTVPAWKKPVAVDMGQGHFAIDEDPHNETYPKVEFPRRMLMGRLPGGFLPTPNTASHGSDDGGSGVIRQRYDHFNATDSRTFYQTFYKNTQFYQPGGPNFLFIGGEAPANYEWISAPDMPILKWAEFYGANVYMLEHRYYGMSVVGDNQDLTYLSSLQALFDIANFINSTNLKHPESSQQWITFGGSYAGSLSAWTRELFPDLVAGAVASSATVQAKTDLFEYLINVEASIKRQSELCWSTIAQGFADLHQLMLSPEGRGQISDLFSLNPAFGASVTELDQQYFFMNLISNFQIVTQYNRLNADKFSNQFGISGMCAIMLNPSQSPIKAIADVNQYITSYYNPTDNLSLNNRYQDLVDYLKTAYQYGPDPDSDRLWAWQVCSEFGWFQSADSGNGIFGASVPVSFYIQLCQDVFGSKHDRTLIGRDIDLINYRYGARMDYQASNVIFPIGSQDPWMTLSMDFPKDTTTIPFRMAGAVHCQDLYPARETDPFDVERVRHLIETSIAKWLVTGEPTKGTTRGMETTTKAGDRAGMMVLIGVVLVLIVN